MEHVLTNTTGNFHLNLDIWLVARVPGLKFNLSSGRVAAQMELPHLVERGLYRGKELPRFVQLETLSHQVSHVLKQ